MTNFTTPNQPGGSHAPISEDTEVVLIPIMGMPNNWVVLGCLPNAVDPPSNHLNRADGTYGFQTQNGILSAYNDEKSSHIQSFPNGVTKSVASDGHIVDQTAGNARSTLTKDGHIIQETPKAASFMSPDGDIAHQNAQGCYSIMDSKGEIKLKSRFESRLSLGKDSSHLISPISKVPESLAALQSSLLGFMGQSTFILANMGELSAEAGASMAEAAGILGNVPTQTLITSEGQKTLSSNPVFADASSVGSPKKAAILDSPWEDEKGLDYLVGGVSGFLSNLENGLGQNIKEGIESLKKLESQPLDTLASLIKPQINLALDLNAGDLLGTVQGVIKNNPGLSLESAIAQIGKIVPEKLNDLIKGLPELKNLSYDSDLLVNGILDKILPGGIGQIQNLMGLEIVGSLKRANSVITEAQEAIIGLDESQLGGLFKEVQAKLIAILPADLRSAITPETVSTIIKSGDVSTLVAGIQKHLVQAAMDSVAETDDFINAVPAINNTLKDIGQGGSFDKILDIPDIVPNYELADAYVGLGGMLAHSMVHFSDSLTPLTEKAGSKIQKVLQTIPAKETLGPSMKLTEKIGYFYSQQEGGAGPSVQLQPEVGLFYAALPEKGPTLRMESDAATLFGSGTNNGSMMKITESESVLYGTGLNEGPTFKVDNFAAFLFGDKGHTGSAPSLRIDGRSVGLFGKALDRGPALMLDNSTGLFSASAANKLGGMFQVDKGGCYGYGSGLGPAASIVIKRLTAIMNAPGNPFGGLSVNPSGVSVDGVKFMPFYLGTLASISALWGQINAIWGVVKLFRKLRIFRFFG